MKILIIQDYLRSGGTERQSVLLTRAFAAAGHAATLLTFRPGGALSIAEAAGSPKGSGSMEHRVLQPRDLHLDWFAPGIHRTVVGLTPDVILCMGRMANCYAGRLQRKFPQTAVVATMRTGKPLPWLYRRSLLHCRAIVANSFEARDHLIAHHQVPPGKISVIHNSLVFPPEPALEDTTLPASTRSHRGLRGEKHSAPSTVQRPPPPSCFVSRCFDLRKTSGS